MFSTLICVVGVVLMVQAQCPCYSPTGDPDYIVCDNTTLTSIPDCVPSNITVLGIRTPSIPLIPDTIHRFTNLKNLEIAYFDNPQISKNFLDGQINISMLSIFATSLDYIDSEWFQYSPKINWLFFASNKITSLASDTFSSLPLLQSLYLSKNQLTTLPPTVFQGTTLLYVSLSDNPWNCDCDLATLMQWTRDNRVTVGDGASCSLPLELQGVDLNDLTPGLACKKIN